jgi:hypothetical protein
MGRFSLIKDSVLSVNIILGADFLYKEQVDRKLSYPESISTNKQAFACKPT